MFWIIKICPHLHPYFKRIKNIIIHILSGYQLAIWLTELLGVKKIHLSLISYWVLF